MRLSLPLALALAAALASGTAAAAPDRPVLRIARAAGPISVDGDLSEPAWAAAEPVTTWFETNPGDNVPPKVANTAWLAYDDSFFYAAFRFDDPDPARIRAPFGDRDDIHSGLDYGGVILDTRNTRRTAVLFLASPRGIQYDAVSNDATGNEDPAPDFFWDSAGRLTDTGWTLELRIPFSSLRYEGSDPQTWGILLYRNWPRDFRYQMMSAPIPRSATCFICNESELHGLSGLPSGASWTVAPYATARRDAAPEAGLGTRLDGSSPDADGGVDAKWTPNPDTVLDATVNPDFSQIESDVAQVGANERFALFFPEKRPFFLESVDLFATPMQAVYTRSIADPRWGARGTGRLGDTQYTVLVAEDQGGGSVILPGPDTSGLAPVDQVSTAGVARVRHDVGRSFVSLLATARELRGEGSNRVIGPDFQWRTGGHTLTGQLLWSRSVTPVAPSAAAEWDGRRLRGHAADAWYSYGSTRYDAFVELKDIADGFRADLGFLPQVGIREGFAETGWTFRPTGFFSRVRAFVVSDRTEDREGGLVFRMISPGFGTDFRWNGQSRVRVSSDRIRARDGRTYPRRQLLFYARVSPSSLLPSVEIDGATGEEIDFVNGRTGHGTRAALSASLRPGNHLELLGLLDRRWLDVPPAGGGPERRLFTATVARLRATYTFHRRSWLRLILQDVTLERDPGLYGVAVDRRSRDVSGSALFAYKLNWQSVLFVGYGDARSEDESDRLQRAGRELFFKLSYAFQG
jgi:hypothetical protein